MAMKSDYIKSVLDRDVADDPIMRDFLEAIYSLDPKSNMRYKAAYNKAIDEALKKREEAQNV